MQKIFGLTNYQAPMGVTGTASSNRIIVRNINGSAVPVISFMYHSKYGLIPNPEEHPDPEFRKKWNELMGLLEK